MFLNHSLSLCCHTLVFYCHEWIPSVEIKLGYRLNGWECSGAHKKSTQSHARWPLNRSVSNQWCFVYPKSDLEISECDWRNVMWLLVSFWAHLGFSKLYFFLFYFIYYLVWISFYICLLFSFTGLQVSYLCWPPCETLQSCFQRWTIFILGPFAFIAPIFMPYKLLVFT